MNIESLGNKKINMAEAKQYPMEYTLDRESYNRFLKEMEKSDFHHAPTRYMVEMKYIENLINSAEKFNLQDELNEHKERKAEIEAELEKYGIRKAK